jgi:hypothetical protein
MSTLLPILSILTLILGLLLTTAFSVWMIMSAAKESWVWVVIILIFPTLGALFYYFTYKPQLSPVAKQWLKPASTVFLICAAIFAVALAASSFTS